MKHFGQKLHLGCFIRIILSELNRQVETSTVPNGILWAKNDSVPVEQTIATRRRLNCLLRRVLMHLLQVFQKTPLRIRTHIAASFFLFYAICLI